MEERLTDDPIALSFYALLYRYSIVAGNTAVTQ